MADSPPLSPWKTSRQTGADSLIPSAMDSPFMRKRSHAGLITRQSASTNTPSGHSLIDSNHANETLEQQPVEQGSRDGSPQHTEYRLRVSRPPGTAPILEKVRSPLDGADSTFSLLPSCLSKPIKPENENYERSSPSADIWIHFRRYKRYVLAMLLLLLLFFCAMATVLTLGLGHHHSLEAQFRKDVQESQSPIRIALPANFPDPALWYANGTWYAFATNNAAGILAQPENATARSHDISNIQLATSKDFIEWNLQPAAANPLPAVGAWALQGLTEIWPRIPRANVWAPSLNQRTSDGRYILYYSANFNCSSVQSSQEIAQQTRHGRGGGQDTSEESHTQNNSSKDHHSHPKSSASSAHYGLSHCIGAAISPSHSFPGGPYEPLNTTLACPVSQGGAIDPSGFTDTDETLYVVYKIDGNNIGHGGLCGNTAEPIVPTLIMLQKLQPDGVTVDGEPVEILDRTASDGPLVEAPDIVRSDEGVYFLFFSSGCTRSPSYDVKYATAKRVDGPYTRAKESLLRTQDWGLLAPGSVGIHLREDIGLGGVQQRWRMAFHARVSMPQGGVRAMFTTCLSLNGTVATMVRCDDVE